MLIELLELIESYPYIERIYAKYDVKRLYELDIRIKLSKKLLGLGDIFEGLYLLLQESRAARCLYELAKAIDWGEIEDAIQLCGDSAIEAYRHKQVKEILRDTVKLARLKEAVEIGDLPKWPLFRFRQKLEEEYLNDMATGWSKNLYSRYDKYIGVQLDGKVFDGLYIHLLYMGKEVEEVAKRNPLSPDEIKAFVDMTLEGERLRKPHEVADDIKPMLEKIKRLKQYKHMLYNIGVLYIVEPNLNSKDLYIYLDALYRTGYRPKMATKIEKLRCRDIENIDEIEIVNMLVYDLTYRKLPKGLICTMYFKLPKEARIMLQRLTYIRCPNRVQCVDRQPIR